MAKLVRRIAAEFTGFVMSRLTAPRIKLCVPITISLDSEKKANAKTIYAKGETKDLSKSGIALIIPAIRLCEKYLVGEDRTIYAQIDLPNGRIKAELIGCRYEQLGIHDSVATYLIGARIVSMSQNDRMLYEEYLKHGDALQNAQETDFAVKVSES
jgi:hypothetical protein